jgi:integrase
MAEIAAEERGQPVPIPHWTFHDLRRTAATGMARLGVPVRVTEAVLNHVSGSRAGIVGVYQKHTWREEARLALESWGAQLQDLVYGHTMPAKVSHLAATRRRLAGAAA